MNNNNEDSEDNGNNELNNDESSVIGTGLRRRKGKIITCAKETIENGEFCWGEEEICQFKQRKFTRLFFKDALYVVLHKS